MINKIFIINLKKSTDRRNHMLKELKKYNFKNYTFIDGVDKDSNKVKNMLKSDFIFKYPPCFRCHKNECNCSNNILIKNQIGNWCSFINIMNIIVKQNLKDLIMICEDDIVFHNYSNTILNNMINKKNFKKNNIYLNKPLLIRLEQRNKYPPINNLRFTKRIYMSNACFLVNKEYALRFIKNLKIINTTSDLFIQKHILKMDKSIQHFTVEPGICNQLSSCANPKMESTIHPKGIDKNDKIRQKNHFKKVNYSNYQYLTKKIFNIYTLSSLVEFNICKNFKRKLIIKENKILKNKFKKYNLNIIYFKDLLNENNNLEKSIFATCNYDYLIIENLKNLLVNYLYEKQIQNINVDTIDEKYLKKVEELYNYYLHNPNITKYKLENNNTLKINYKEIKINYNSKYDLLNKKNKELVNNFKNTELELLSKKIYDN